MPITTKLVDNTARFLIDVASVDHDENFEGELATAIEQASATTAEEIELWIHGVDDATDAIALTHGAIAYRDLWQVTCQLPVTESSLTTRAFTLDDADALIAVNNRAFAWHPEQGGMTRETLDATMAEPWFNADGFRLFERNGELLGFCWTKIHTDLDPVMGEIYVIAVDPSAHGQGLGTPMTLAGLDWIHAQGIEQAMLYVESDNDAANATYRRIGFVPYKTHRAYRIELNAGAPEPTA